MELALLKGEAEDPRARQFCQEVQGWVHDACQAHHRLAKGPWRAKDAKAKAHELKKQLERLCRDSLRYPKAEKLRLRLLGPEQQLIFTCFRHPGVTPTNCVADPFLNQGRRSYELDFYHESAPCCEIWGQRGSKLDFRFSV